MTDTSPNNTDSPSNNNDSVSAVPDIREAMKDVVLSKNGSMIHVSVAGKSLTSIPREIHGKFGSGIESLDLSWNEITTVTNVDRFSRLKSLVLDNNCIESLSNVATECPRHTFQHLETLSLNNNALTDLDELLDLLSDKQRFPALTYLSLLKNPCCPNELSGQGNMEDYQRYRLYVLWRLKNLKFLDSRQVTAEERRDAEKRGKFCKVAKPDYSKIQQQAAAIAGNDIGAGGAEGGAGAAADSDFFVAQPAKTQRTGEETQSFFGYTKHVYTGRHSEGNRFIRNNDL